MNKKILVVVVLVVAGAAFFLFGRGPSEVSAPAPQPAAQPPAPAQAPAPAQVSANPDAIVADLQAAVEPLDPIVADPSLVSSDDEAMSGFDQSSNPNQF